MIDIFIPDRIYRLEYKAAAKLEARNARFLRYEAFPTIREISPDAVKKMDDTFRARIGTFEYLGMLGENRMDVKKICIFSTINIDNYNPDKINTNEDIFMAPVDTIDMERTETLAKANVISVRVRLEPMLIGGGEELPDTDTVRKDISKKIKDIIYMDNADIVTENEEKIFPEKILQNVLDRISMVKADISGAKHHAEELIVREREELANREKDVREQRVELARIGVSHNKTKDALEEVFDNLKAMDTTGELSAFADFEAYYRFIYDKL